MNFNDYLELVKDEEAKKLSVITKKYQKRLEEQKERTDKRFNRLASFNHWDELKELCKDNDGDLEKMMSKIEGDFSQCSKIINGYRKLKQVIRYPFAVIIDIVYDYEVIDKFIAAIQILGTNPYEKYVGMKFTKAPRCTHGYDNDWCDCWPADDECNQESNRIENVHIDYQLKPLLEKFYQTCIYRTSDDRWSGSVSYCFNESKLTKWKREQEKITKQKQSLDKEQDELEKRFNELQVDNFTT